MEGEMKKNREKREKKERQEKQRNQEKQEKQEKQENQEKKRDWAGIGVAAFCGTIFISMMVYCGFHEYENSVQSGDYPTFVGNVVEYLWDAPGEDKGKEESLKEINNEILDKNVGPENLHSRLTPTDSDEKITVYRSNNDKYFVGMIVFERKNREACEKTYDQFKWESSIITQSFCLKKPYKVIIGVKKPRKNIRSVLQ